MKYTLHYVTKLIFSEYLKTSFLLILKLIIKFLHLFLLKQIIRNPIIL